MKKFNLKVFIIFGMIFVLLNVLSWSGLEAYTTQDKSHPIAEATGSLWTILRFPCFTFFQKFIFRVDNVVLYSIAVALNCVFFAVVAERLYYLLHLRPIQVNTK